MTTSASSRPSASSASFRPSASSRPLDVGTGYGRKPPTWLSHLTDAGPGTPMGMLMRRYRHPVGLSSQATATPRAVRVLGEDLMLFRDGSGRAGLVVARCAHRGTTLYYGNVEERGIRCCHHTSFDPAAPPVVFEAGNFVVDG